MNVPGELRQRPTGLTIQGMVIMIGGWLFGLWLIPSFSQSVISNSVAPLSSIQLVEIQAMYTAWVWLPVGFIPMYLLLQWIVPRAAEALDAMLRIQRRAE